MSSVSPITPGRAATAFEGVFASRNAFDSPFRDDVESRALLFPVPLQFEAAGELDALAKLAEAIGDAGFIFTISERVIDAPAVEDWYIPLDARNEYFTLTRGVENALVSPTGRWAILFSHEGHALIGGEGSFANQFLELTGRSWKGEVEAFLTEWRVKKERFGASIEWIEPLLRHIYGERFSELATTIRSATPPDAG